MSRPAPVRPPPRVILYWLPYQFKPEPYSSHAALLRIFDHPGNGQRVLDLGCAGGYLCELLAGRGYGVTGVDLPGTAPRPGFRFIEADLDQGLPPLDGSFDTVVCADILEHLREPHHVLRQVREVLAPTGVLVASLPNSGHLYFRLTVLSGRFPRHVKGLFDRTHLHFYTWDGWCELFQQCGFRIARIEPTGTPVGLRFPRLAQSPPVRAAEWISYQLARLRKQLFAYQFVVIARPENEP